MTVSDVSHEEALQTAADKLATDAETLDAVAVDISFYDTDGNELEPAGNRTVQVEITLPEEMKLDEGEYNLLHVSDDGDVQKLEEATVSESGAEFVAEAFSMYILTSNGSVDKNSALMVNGIAVNNSSENPYVIAVGQEIEVWYSGDYLGVPQNGNQFTVYNNDHENGKVIDRVSGTSEITEDGYRKVWFVGLMEGTCRIVKASGIGNWGSEEYVGDDLWVRVVDSVYILNGQNRNQITDYNLTYNVGDTFTLSVDGNCPNLIAPKNGEDPNNAYNLSDYLYRGKPYLKNGNTYVDFVCRQTAVNGNTDNRQHITVAGHDITLTINNPYLYRVEDGNRNRIYGDTTIYVDKNKSFTLSVNDRANHRLPHNNYSEDAFTLNEILNRGATSYTTINVNGATVNTTNVEFTALQAGSTSFTANDINIGVEIFDSYLMVDNKRTPIIEALKHLNNSTDRKLYLLEGETLTFSLDGSNRGNDFSVADSTILSKGNPVNGTDRTDVTFTAQKHGVTTVTVNGREYQIIVEHPMYVKSATIERDFDRINEWLAVYAAGTKKNGYHPNANEPYLMYDEDTLSLRVPKNSDTSNLILEIGTPYREWRENNNYHREDVNENVSLETVNGSLSLNGDNIDVTLKAHNTSDYAEVIVPIYLKNNNDTLRTMLVKIQKNQHKMLDHADIEIADGGKYTVTKLKRNADGSYTKTIVEYDAFVNGVNYSKLFKSTDNSTTCQFYTSDSGATQHGSNVTGFVDYYVDPRYQPGEPQYEYTSKYKPVLQPDGTIDYQNWSNRWYYASDVDHVLFDVKLGLVPIKKTEYHSNGSGGWDQGSSQEIQYDITKMVTLDKVQFIMDHQAVLDAYNKCPNHTGLDFTVMANSALVEFDLNKELTNGTIADKQFSFEVLQKETQFVRRFLDYPGTISKSDYNQKKNDGLKFTGAHRIFYQNPAIWGDGIDHEALVAELKNTPEFSNLSSFDAPAIFDIAQNDNSDNQERRKKLFRIMQQYLINPEQLEDDGDNYKVQDEGFYLLSFESDPLQTVQNNADGLVTFNALHFEKTGEYNYIIREVRDGMTSDGIIYDRKEIDLQIQVSPDATNVNQLTADITSDMTDYKFTNILLTYNLPSTGGTGVMPYILGGTGLMGAAFLLFLRKRKGAC
jgi:pilin isopeptide linkage protein/LPXTG-motif cell wall-anchored protein